MLKTHTSKMSLTSFSWVFALTNNSGRSWPFLRSTVKKFSFLNIIRKIKKFFKIIHRKVRYKAYLITLAPKYLAYINNWFESLTIKLKEFKFSYFLIKLCLLNKYKFESPAVVADDLNKNVSFVDQISSSCSETASDAKSSSFTSSNSNLLLPSLTWAT